MVSDAAAGLHVVGGHAEPVVGRKAQLASARAALARAEAAETETKARMDLERLRHQTASAEVERARHAAAVPTLREEVERLDREVSEAATKRGALSPKLQSAFDALVSARSRRDSRKSAVKAWESSLEVARMAVAASEKAVAELRKQIGDLRLEYWETGWCGTQAEAASELAKLAPGQSRDQNTIRIAASQDLNEAAKAYAGPDTDPSTVPELAEVAGRRQALTGEETADRAFFDEMLQPLKDLLDQHLERDTVVEERIERERQQRAQEISLAEQECGKLSAALAQVQDAIEDLIRNALTEVSREFNRLDSEASGFGASIHVDCKRPIGPTDPWMWEATPRWRRSPTGSLLPYHHQTNSAQEKQHTVHLVLAALLSSPNSAGRVLVLDELGDSLGVQHRQEVLRAVSACAQSRGFTVLATCQDAVLPDATRFCGQVVYFEYASKSDALNRPTRVFGFDANRERVELTLEDVTRGRGWL
jgi:hypothetical protein